MVRGSGGTGSWTGGSFLASNLDGRDAIEFKYQPFWGRGKKTASLRDNPQGPYLGKYIENRRKNNPQPEPERPGKLGVHTCAGHGDLLKKHKSEPETRISLVICWLLLHMSFMRLFADLSKDLGRRLAR